MQLISWIAQIPINYSSHYSPPSYSSTLPFLAKHRIIFLLVLNIPFGSTAHKILLLNIIMLLLLFFLYFCTVHLQSLWSPLIYNCLPFTILIVRDNLLIYNSTRTEKQLSISITYWKYIWRTSENNSSIFWSTSCQMPFLLTLKQIDKSYISSLPFENLFYDDFKLSCFSFFNITS